ncbi:hypothetical protein [Peribacillus simplex]|uniref:hypothetical protein n=1 Tax=Peribacillus simplex TaxID=1478 RepID=UPI003D2DD990
MSKTLTTGVINKTASTQATHVEILNLSNHQKTVTVQVYNWDAGGTLLAPPETITINPNEHVTATNVDLTGVIHYEIRLIIHNNHNDRLIINTFAINSVTTLTVENNNVLHHELVELSDDESSND